MGSFLKIIIKFLFGLILGIIPAIWIIQNDRHVKKITIQPLIKHLEDEWNAKIKVEKITIDIFSGNIELKNLLIISLAETACNWHCKNGSIAILKRSSIRDNKLNLHITLNENKIYTEYNNSKLGLVLLLQSIFKNQPENLNSKSFSINNVKIINPQKKIKISLPGNLYAKKDKNNLWQGRLSTNNGSIKINKKIICKNVHGITRFYEPNEAGPTEVGTNKTFEVPVLGKNNSFLLTGEWGKSSKLLTLNSQQLLSANLSQNDPDISAEAKINLKNLDFLKKYLPKRLINLSPRLSYKNNNLCISAISPNKHKININFKNKIKITSSYALLQSLLPINVRKWMLGNRGTIAVELGASPYYGKIRFSNGKIHIPGSYNLITDFSTNFFADINTKQIQLSNTTIKLHKGTITSKQAKILIQDGINFLCADVQTKDLLVNWQDDFFGIIDSKFFIKSKKTSPISISGDVIIKKSLIKDNIFSQDSQQQIIGNIPINIDINISNKDQLSIKMPFLQTKATTDLNVKIVPNTPFCPKVAGSILLRHGTLTFPRNKLFITSGKIDFISTQNSPASPMVYLEAKNRIKKYTITLIVTGPLQKPSIFLESTPELTEEQIIALLFAGSESINLQSQLPAIIMQNLSNLILGSKKSLPASISFFQKLTKPLKYIQITPNFSNQSGRGGVMGNISIDINKQLHAQIQKNLTMQDDLAFQLEYFLSDDFNIKAIKDRRGDIGAEVEISLS